MLIGEEIIWNEEKKPLNIFAFAYGTLWLKEDKYTPPQVISVLKAWIHKSVISLMDEF